MPRSLTKKRERQKQGQIQPAYERVAKSNDNASPDCGEDNRQSFSIQLKAFRSLRE